MLELEKILVKIVLALVAALFLVLLFNSCKATKNVVKTEIDSAATQVTVVDSHTTDNSKTEEDYTEVVYVLDSGQSVSFSDMFGNTEQAPLIVREIKVKNSHVTKENDISNKTYATERKTAEMKENVTQVEKTKPNTAKNLRIVAVLFFSIVVALALWRFYQKLN